MLGHSWGPIVGLMVAAKRPDLLHAYVGVGQVIDFRQNEREGYAWTLAKEKSSGNIQSVREMEALRPYPGPGEFDLKKLETERKWNIRFGGLAANRHNADFYFRAPRLSPDYTTADRQAWSDGSALTMKTMFPKLADISFAKLNRIATPVFLFLGRHDYMTPSLIAAAWLDRLRAPSKRVVWF